MNEYEDYDEESIEIVKENIIECSEELFEEAINEAINFQNYTNSLIELIAFINGYIIAKNNN